MWGLYEFYLISEKLGAKPFKLFGFISGALFFFGAFFQNAQLLEFSSKIGFSGGITAIMLVFFAALFSKSKNPFKDIAYTITGVIYTVIPFVILTYFSCADELSPCNLPYSFDSNYNPRIILGLFFLIWANDSYAYLLGSIFGKKKLFERISPAKTWEGTLGGGILTLASSFLIAKWFSEFSSIQWLMIAFIVVVAGTLGDLTESMLKRQAGIKDSGKIMPGHGGILDRFDSVMFIAPFVYLYSSIMLS